MNEELLIILTVNLTVNLQVLLQTSLYTILLLYTFTVQSFRSLSEEKLEECDEYQCQMLHKGRAMCQDQSDSLKETELAIY